MHHPVITTILLAAAALLCLLCAVGLFAMRDAFQRLHFSSPIASLAIFFFVVAIWLEDPDWQSRIKSALIALFLFFMNSVLSHATARAIHIRRTGHWPPSPDEHLPIVTRDHPSQKESP